MAKTTFLATDPNGGVHKRTSENRTYTHTVVVKLGRAYAERRLAEALAYETQQAPKDYDYYVSYTDGREQAKTDRKYPGLYDQARWDAKKVEYTARLAGRTVEQYTADQLAAIRAGHAKRLADGWYDRWDSIGWCGRPDLAQKLAANPRFTAPEAVMILAAVKKGGA